MTPQETDRRWHWGWDRGCDMMRAEERETEGAAGDGGSSRGTEEGMRGRLGSRGLPRGCAAIQAGASEGGPRRGRCVPGVVLPAWPRCPRQSPPTQDPQEEEVLHTIPSSLPLSKQGGS